MTATSSCFGWCIFPAVLSLRNLMFISSVSLHWCPPLEYCLCLNKCASAFLPGSVPPGCCKSSQYGTFKTGMNTGAGGRPLAAFVSSAASLCTKLRFSAQLPGQCVSGSACRRSDMLYLVTTSFTKHQSARWRCIKHKCFSRKCKNTFFHESYLGNNTL